MLAQLQPRRGCLGARPAAQGRSRQRHALPITRAVETVGTLFDGFVKEAGATTSLQLKESQFDNGLFTPAAVAKGQVGDPRTQPYHSGKAAGRPSTCSA